LSKDWASRLINDPKDVKGLINASKAKKAEILKEEGKRLPPLVVYTN